MSKVSDYMTRHYMVIDLIEAAAYHFLYWRVDNDNNYFGMLVLIILYVCGMWGGGGEA